MKEFEILSRASAFLVKSRFNGAGPAAKHKFPQGRLKPIAGAAGANGEKGVHTFVPRYHVVTASHVVAPWLWPKYYPDEWLRYVNQSHTHYTLELRNEEGVFVTQSECFPVSYHHRNRDLAVLHLEDEAGSFKMLQDLDFHVPELLLPPSLALAQGSPLQGQASGFPSSEQSSSESLYHFLRKGEVVNLVDSSGVGDASAAGKRLEFVGHDVSDAKADASGGDARRCFPLSTHGHVHGRTQAQLFCQTARPLTEGMCGGPVLTRISAAQSVTPAAVTNAGKGKGKSRTAVPIASQSNVHDGDLGNEVAIVGMVEGIVPLDYTDKSMRGLAVFVEAPLVHEFLQEIEQGPLVSGVEPLVGGESVEFIATTQHTPEFVMPEV